MKVKIKSWERMVEEFGYWCSDVYSINLKLFNWTKDLEDEIPDNRIIEVSIRGHIYKGVEKKEYYYRDYGISPDAIEEYLTDVKEIKTGDVVYIIDCDDINLSSEKFAMNADTITNEFLSRITYFMNRNSRS